jgi:peptidyl-prolyl cis-trans isomerase C
MEMNLYTKIIAASLLTASAVLGFQSAPVFAAETKAPAAESQTAPAKSEAAPQESPTDVLAKVNGAPITRAEVDRATQILISQNRLPATMDAATKKQAENAALEQLINAEIVYQEGLKLNIKDLDKQVADRVAQGKAKFPTSAEYEAALKANNLTDKDILELIRKDIVIGKVFENEVTGKVKVSDEEAKKFYDENKDKFQKPESYHASHILIGVKPDATPAEKNKAREKAESIRKKLLAGEDFATLAKADSTCPSSKQGGDLGFFSKGEMVPPFEKATAALKPGEISGVVETQFGYHIIKLIEKKPGGSVSFNEAKENIENYLKQTKTQKAIEELLTRLKGSAKVTKTGA